MLKNKNNGKLYLKANLSHMGASTTGEVSELKKMGRILRFIEQCPLKIKRLKIEGFL